MASWCKMTTLCQRFNKQNLTGHQEEVQTLMKRYRPNERQGAEDIFYRQGTTVQTKKRSYEK